MALVDLKQREKRCFVVTDQPYLLDCRPGTTHARQGERIMYAYVVDEQEIEHSLHTCVCTYVRTSH